MCDKQRGQKATRLLFHAAKHGACKPNSTAVCRWLQPTISTVSYCTHLHHVWCKQRLVAPKQPSSTPLLVCIVTRHKRLACRVCKMIHKIVRSNPTSLHGAAPSRGKKPAQWQWRPTNKQGRAQRATSNIDYHMHAHTLHMACGPQLGPQTSRHTCGQTWRHCLLLLHLLLLLRPCTLHLSHQPATDAADTATT